MRRRILGLVCGVSCALASALGAAEVGLRPDLAGRLAQLWPIYGDGDFYEGTVPVLKHEGLRVIALSGVIEVGDADRLQAVIGPVDSASGFVLVLDSPGGSFVEGVKIGQMLQPYRGGNGDPSLTGVVVLRGAECMSACAVGFALAALPRDSGVSARYIEVGGRLGFHMPFVPVAQQSAQTEIARAMDLTYEVMSQYIRLVGNGLAPVALVQNALHYRRPEDFFLLQGGLVTRFMDFVPVAGAAGATPLSLSGLTQRDALSMCQILTFAAGRRMTADEYEWWSMNANSDLPDTTPLADLFNGFGARRLAVTGCTIAWRDGDLLAIDDSGDCGRDFEGGGWCAVPEDDFALPVPWASGALLADSLGCHGGKLTQEFYDWDWRNAFLEEEAPEDYRWPGHPANWPVQRLDWSGAKLASNVNLRSAPGGDRLTELAEGTELRVTNCALTADGQGVWYEVHAGALTVGWVSGRYVTVPALEQRGFMVRPVGFQ